MIISLQIYCTCGSYVRGAVTPQEADSLMQAFSALHVGEGHAPCQAWDAAMKFGQTPAEPWHSGPGAGNSLN